MPFISQKAKNGNCLFTRQLLFVASDSFALAFFALLVGDAAGGFTGRLAGGLAFAAAAVFQALIKVTRFKCNNSFHHVTTLRSLFFLQIIIIRRLCQCVTAQTIKTIKQKETLPK
jgi:hypothetical protein